MRTWTRLVPAILLALPVTGSSFAANAASNANDIDKLQKEVKQLREEVQKLQDAMKLNDVRGAEIQTKLNEILHRLDGVAKHQQEIERIAAYGPPSMPGGAIPGGAVPMTTAMVRLENRYPSAAQVRINGRIYTVGGFQTIQVLRVPTGGFEYSVEVDGMMIRPPHMETLPATGYHITIYQP